MKRIYSPPALATCISTDVEAGVGFEPTRPLGYEPNKLPTALPRIILYILYHTLTYLSSYFLSGEIRP